MRALMAEADLISKIKRLERVKDGIEVGAGLSDVHGRVLAPDGRYFNDDGSFSGEVVSLIENLNEKKVDDMIRAGIMYYDIRSKFWKDNPEFNVVLALAFAKQLQKRLGKEDGIVLHIGVDAYQKHFDAAQIFVDAILRTGITDNGGGICYWGVINGGDTRNYGQLFHAQNEGQGGNWIYFTMSHRPEPFVGCKMGVDAKVFSGTDLRHVEGVTEGTLYDTISEKDFVEIQYQKPTGDIITIADMTRNNIQVAADLIKATSAPEDVSTNELLKDISVGVDMSGSPIYLNLVKILRGLGAHVEVLHDKLDPSFKLEYITDPNEHRSENMETLRKRAVETEKPWLIMDPDGDRGGMAVSYKGEGITLTGSDMLSVAMEALAHNYKNKGFDAPTVIADMRTGVGARDLAEALNKEGIPIKSVPVEAGYPFFMRAMAALPADMAVENSTHEFLTPMTNSRWGAPTDYPGYQGGDNAALFLIYLLANQKYLWEGRNAYEQLMYLNEKYNLRKTVAEEVKPMLPPEQDEFKYFIADELKKLGTKLPKEHFGVNFDDERVTLVSGIHVTAKTTGAMALVRYSNTGSSFTISGAAYSKEDLTEIIGLGTLMMKTAAENVQKEKGDCHFDLNDAKEYDGVFDASKYEIDLT